LFSALQTMSKLHRLLSPCQRQIKTDSTGHCQQRTELACMQCPKNVAHLATVVNYDRKSDCKIGLRSKYFKLLTIVKMGFSGHCRRAFDFQPNLICYGRNFVSESQRFPNDTNFGTASICRDSFIF